MIISAKKIIELNKKYNLIENLAERELNPQGVGLDVRVGGVYKLKEEGFLGVSDEDRKTPAVEKIADANQKKIELKPGDFVLVKTIEKVNIPARKVVIEEGREPMFLMLDVYPRSTLQRSGVYFMGTKTDPGYSGELTVALANVGNSHFKLELGARIANLVFKQVFGDVNPYEGPWQGGRVSTENFE
jgi:deoxycytidine triphosphate deaminase